MTLSEYMYYFPNMDVTSFMIGSLIGALISAFFGFRLFKLSVVVSSASGGFLLGYAGFDFIFPEGIAGVGFDVGLVVGLLFAVIIGIVAIKVYKGLIYFVGGLFGVMLGFFIPWSLLTMAGHEMIGIVVGVVLAVVLAILCAKGFMKLMKPLVIIETALGGMALAFESVAILLTPDESIVTLATFLGLIVGIFAAKYQFSINQGRELFGKD